METRKESPKQVARASSLVSRLAVLAILALVAVGCGANSTNLVAESPPPSIDVEYGATLDEWATAAGASNATEDAGAELVEEVGQEPRRSSTDPAYTDVDWEDLIPAGFSSNEVWEKYLAEFDEVEYGSPEEQALYDKVQAEIDPDIIDPALDGQKIRMNGFVAPLTYDEDVVTEFLLVPYFGACIHVPAPPSNQTVLVKVDKDNGLTTDEAWGAVWVEGTMNIEPATTDIGSASYAITGGKSGVYEEF